MARSFDEFWEDSEQIQTDGEEIWIRCKQRQSRGLIHVDYLSFSVRAASKDEDSVRSLAFHLADRLCLILGGQSRECKGVNFYEHGLKIISADSETLLAGVWFGGEHQRGTVHCQIPGSGWLNNDESLNKKIFDLLVDFDVQYLSRIDFARDCFDSETDFEQMSAAYERGEFKPSRGVMPSTWAVVDEHRGSTRYVGRRENGRCIRGYEKSMQLARKRGWFRVEVELRSVNRRIPLEAVLDPAAFFAGTCRFCAELADTARVQRVITRQKTVELSVSHLTDYARIAYGKLIALLADSGADAQTIVDRLVVGVSGVPRRLKVCSREQILRAVGLASPAEDSFVTP